LTIQYPGTVGPDFFNSKIPKGDTLTSWKDAAYSSYYPTD